MKKFNFLVLVSTLLFIASSCNKDYPKDIPDCLKDKIKGLKKDSKGKGCGSHGCKYIWEYSDGSNTIFLYRKSPDFSPTAYIVYDFDGNKICIYQPSMTSICLSFDMNDFHFIRKFGQKTNIKHS